MNAIPQRHQNQNYNRLSKPAVQTRSRNSHMPNIEYLDDHRAAKLATQREQRELEYYSRNAQAQRQPETYVKANVPSKEKHFQRRKLTAAYAVTNRNPKRDPIQAAYEHDIALNEFYYNLKPQKEVAKKAEKPVAQQVYREQPVRKQKRYAQAMAMQPAYVGVAVPVYQPEAEELVQLPRQEKERAEYVRSKSKGVVSTIFSILLVFLMLSAVLVKQADIAKQTYTNAQMESNISELQQELDKLKMDKALKEDLGSIQQRATELGMHHPNDDQVVFMKPMVEPAASAYALGDIEDVPIEQNENVTVEGDDAENGTGDNAFDKVANIFNNLASAIKGWIDG